MSDTGDSVNRALTVWAVVAGAVLAGAILVLMAQAPVWGWLVLAVFALLTGTALLSFGDPASRAFLAGTLRKSTYRQIYTTLTRRAVMRLWDALCDPADARAAPATLLRAALTWRLYDRALLIAVAYPIGLLVGQWVVTGAPAMLGEAEVIPAAPFWWDRAVVVGIFALLIAAKIGEIRLSASPKRVLKLVSVWLAPIAFVAAFAVAGVLAVAVTVAFLFSGAVSVAVSVAIVVMLAGIGIGIVAVVVACAVVVAIPLLTDRLDERGRPALARWLVSVLLLIALLVTAAFADLASLPDDLRAIFLFLGVFPLLNAVFDTASYAVTLTLMRRGLRSRLPLLWGLADLVIACVLFLALGAALVGTVQGLNALSETTLLDLPALLTAARADPMAHVWLYLMLFSTIVPTALHAGLSLLGVQGLWPRAWRRPVAVWIEQAPTSPMATLRAGLALGVIWTLPLVVLGGIVWALWQIAGGVITTGLAHYFDALMRLAA